jgi:deazaflavin-dependent oxidoreductase (nitroreductase family)
MNRIGAALNALGFFPHGSVTLETVGPKTGKPLVLPLVIAKYDHREFLVSMLGQGSRWVHNVRSADGRATLRAGRRRRVLLREVAVEKRAPILKAYLARAPGARPHIPVDRRAPVASFEAIAADYPVFEIFDDPRTPAA